MDNCIIYCNQCGGENIVYEHVPVPKPKPTRISMNEKANEPVSTIVPAIHIIERFRYRCTDCGYFIEDKMGGLSIDTSSTKI